MYLDMKTNKCNYIYRKKKFQNHMAILLVENVGNSQVNKSYNDK